MAKNDEEVVRVVRVLEYVGPRKWLKVTMKNSYIKPHEIAICGVHRFVRELACQELPYDGIAINKTKGGDQETKPTSDQ